MMLENVQSYFKSNIELLERELTILSFNWSDVNLSDIEHDDTIDTLKQKYKENLLNNLDDTSKDVLYYCNMHLDEWFTKALDTIHLLYLKRTKIKDIMLQLKKLRLPEQRSEEWYQIRENLLTASSLADSLGKGHFQTRDGLLINKTSPQKPFITNTNRDIMQWGVKYEHVATEFYEYLNNLKIIEFGLIPHPQLSVFGASPDGIADIGSPEGYEGRMLEIKCPPKRNFTHEVPRHYWMQMQGQLEVCDLEECDFFQVKLEEYYDVKEYEADVLVKDGLQHGLTKDGLPKGLVIAYTKKDSLDIEYKYSPWLEPLDSILNWQKEVLHELKEDYSIYEMKWWRIERYECTLVRRDKEWWLSIVPNIIQFWKDVTHYREVGNEEVHKRINGRKRGPRKKVFTIQEPIKGYLMESDED